MNAALTYLAQTSGAQEAIWIACALLAGGLGGALLEATLLTRELTRQHRRALQAVAVTAWEDGFATCERAQTVVARHRLRVLRQQQARKN
jgi:hypothetical protein